MAGEWRLAKLSDLGEVNRGRSRHRPRDAAHLYGGPYPFVQTGDIKASGGRIVSYSQTYSEAGLAQSRLWPKGTMCITIAANIAESGVLSFPACFPDSVIGFIADDRQADVYFVEYAFRMHKRRLQHEASGSVQDNINLQTLERLELPVPELREQRAIAHILGTLDDKIELNRRMNETLEAIARAIFKSWFVDFEPVRAKARGEPPESVCRRLGLTPDLLALFPDRLVDSELGEIPEGWEVRRLDTIASLVTTSISPASQPDTVFEHYSIPAFDVAAMPSYELGSTIKSNKYVVSPLAVLVSKLNPETPRVWLPAVKTDAAICSTEFMQFVPHSANNRAYLYLMMRSDRMQAEILKRVTGSTGSRQRAQPSQVVTLPVIVPLERAAESFDAIAASMLALIAQSREQSRTLRVVRDTLLPKLLSGELRVPLEGVE